jgi:hypothetical protein
MAAVARLVMVDLECGDPLALAAFYHALVGWDIEHGQHNYAVLRNRNTRIRRRRVDRAHRPPPASRSACSRG